MAIALDTSADLGSSASPLSVSYTCTGANRALFVFLYLSGSSDTITAVTYNGVALTQLKKIQASFGSFCYLYGLLGPASGANTLAITSSAGTIQATAQSYTGVLQSGLPDATQSGTQAAGPGTFAQAITTVLANCWIAAMCVNGGAAPTANTNLTGRRTDSVLASGDSNGPVSAGSNSQTWNVNSGSGSAFLQASFAPIQNTGAMFQVF